MWRGTFEQFIVDELGFREVHVETCVYVKKINSILAIIIVYVDDFIIGCTCKDTYKEIESKLVSKYKVKRLPLLNRFLGINFSRIENTWYMNQEDVILKLCQDCKLESGRNADIPWQNGFQFSEKEIPFTNGKIYRSAIGVLLWVARCTRPDILFHVCYLSMFNNNPLEVHWEHVKKIIIYLRSTMKMGISLGGKKDKNLIAYCDASHGDPMIGRKSTTGYMFFIHGTPFAWISRRQKVITISSTEAEYYAMSEMAVDANFYMQVLNEFLPVGKTLAMVDSESGRKIASGDTSLRKVKHMEIRHHYVREMAVSGRLTLQWIPNEENVADSLTKAISKKPLFRNLRNKYLVDVPIPPGNGQ